MSFTDFDKVEQAFSAAGLINTKSNRLQKTFHLNVEKQITGEIQMFVVKTTTTLPQANLAAQLALASHNILGYRVYVSELQPKQPRSKYLYIIIILFIMALLAYYANSFA